ncbi:MAG: type I phosphomannose isomerase catalytic subunit [Culicoidibacterales bacterium]
MEILKLAPAVKDYLWGGRKLVDLYNKESDLPKVAETWEMSNHKDGSSTIVNGQYTNSSFKTYLEIEGKRVWGEKGEKYQNFPVLIKFIDAEQPLSIQVHPDDAYALKYEGEFGKNEFWYVLEAEEGSILYYGMREKITNEQFRESIEKGTICNYLKKVEVKKGDCFFIKAGTIHAIGAGIVIAEIQQCSNSTYRVYDFDRVDADGNPRELHVDKAADVTILKPSGKNGEADGIPQVQDGNTSTLLTKNEYFTCVKYDVKVDVQLIATQASFNSILVVEGSGTLISSSQQFKIQKGDSYFIPAGYGSYMISGEVSVILTTL